jgi:hypothetical protein
MKAMKAALAAVYLLAAGPALAALAVPASVEDLARASDTVVRGRVVKVSARWSSDGKRISTYAEVEPAGVWRGSAPTRVTVVVPGGVVGDIGQRVDGAPTFSEGEDVVVFLAQAGATAFRVQGLAQGKFAVVDGVARPEVSHLGFVDRPALRAGERRAEAMAVEELEQRVRAAK